MERKKEKSGLTFRQLQEMVGSGTGHKTPTARQLTDSGEEPVAVREIGPDGSLSVYPGGTLSTPMEAAPPWSVLESAVSIHTGSMTGRMACPQRAASFWMEMTGA